MYTLGEFKLKFSALLKAYDGKYTENSKKLTFLINIVVWSLLPRVIYPSICRNSFLWNLKSKKINSSVYGILNESLSLKHIKSYRINKNIVKYREFKKSKVTPKVTLHPNKAPTFLLLHAITNEKTVKLMQIDRLLSASKTFSAETRSSNSGRYTLIKSHIPWIRALVLGENGLQAVNKANKFKYLKCSSILAYKYYISFNLRSQKYVF